MKKLKFKPYVGRAYDGTPCYHDLSDFNMYAATTYIEIQAMPAGRLISFQTALEIWIEEMVDRMKNHDPERPLYKVCNFTGFIASLGYQIRIEPDEIEWVERKS